MSGNVDVCDVPFVILTVLKANIVLFISRDLFF